jgi:hypothetical protein
VVSEISADSFRLLRLDNVPPRACTGVGASREGESQHTSTESCVWGSLFGLLVGLLVVLVVEC